MQFVLLLLALVLLLRGLNLRGIPPHVDFWFAYVRILAHVSIGLGSALKFLAFLRVVLRATCFTVDMDSIMRADLGDKDSKLKALVSLR